ncbi:MAG: sulfite exporter TauE/SafE family protein [Coxiellaceae bacterium]|nr:sulfite exporter TauE/SafE family protein [Coxiellaceae bacterium]
MDQFIVILLYIFSGVLAGISAGLLGAGGGTVVVPLLAIIFLHRGAPMTTAMHTAVGTSLAIMIITTIASTMAHAKRGSVCWDIFYRLLPGIAIGALLGALVANALPGALLHKIFAVFLVLASIQMAFQFIPTLRKGLRGWFSLSTFGLFSGAVASGLGIGGSIFNVPFLVMNRLSMRDAVGTTAVSGLPTALVGAVVFLIAGWGLPNLPPNCIGFINIPALCVVSIVTMLTAGLGVRWAHKLEPEILRWVFSVFLLVIAISMLIE